MTRRSCLFIISKEDNTSKPWFYIRISIIKWKIGIQFLQTTTSDLSPYHNLYSWTLYASRNFVLNAVFSRLIAYLTLLTQHNSADVSFCRGLVNRSRNSADFSTDWQIEWWRVLSLGTTCRQWVAMSDKRPRQIVQPNMSEADDSIHGMCLGSGEMWPPNLWNCSNVFITD